MACVEGSCENSFMESLVYCMMGWSENVHFVALRRNQFNALKGKELARKKWNMSEERGITMPKAIALFAGHQFRLLLECLAYGCHHEPAAAAAGNFFIDSEFRYRELLCPFHFSCSCPLTQMEGWLEHFDDDLVSSMAEEEIRSCLLGQLMAKLAPPFGETRPPPPDRSRH
ncbi:hypothetical protein Dimus_033090 [Dionaea muscipula]